MTKYKCHQCGNKSDKPGMCEKCGKPFDKTCAMCGSEIHICTCRPFTPETKGHAPR